MYVGSVHRCEGDQMNCEMFYAFGLHMFNFFFLRKKSCMNEKIILYTVYVKMAYLF